MSRCPSPNETSASGRKMAEGSYGDPCDHSFCGRKCERFSSWPGLSRPWTLRRIKGESDNASTTGKGLKTRLFILAACWRLLTLLTAWMAGTSPAMTEPLHASPPSEIRLSNKYRHKSQAESGERRNRRHGLARRTGNWRRGRRLSCLSGAIM